jgi:hypothetical protein
MTDFPLGIRWMQTFRKLPTTRPRRKTKLNMRTNGREEGR